MSTTIELTTEEAAALNRVGERLRRLLDASTNLIFESMEPPVTGSPLDIANKAGLREPYDFAGALLHSTEDHLRTIFIVLTTGPLPSYGLYALERVAADAAVRCAHLVAPKISETLRLGRGLNERRYNLIQARKAGLEEAHFQSRLQRIEERALAHGVTPKRAKNKDGTEGELLGFGESVRTLLDLFSAYLHDGRATFRFLSAHIHSMAWVQLETGRATRTGPGMSKVPTDLDVVRFATILDRVLALHDANVGHWLRLGGYPPAVWSAAKHAA